MNRLTLFMRSIASLFRIFSPFPLCAVFTVGLLAHSSNALAQMPSEERNASEGRQLETVTIRERRSIAQRFFAAGSLVTVDRQDIEAMGADSVADVLRQLPGVQVNGSGNGTLEIRMRGMDKSATQILVDGEKVSGARQSAQLPFDQLPADMIERIEVLRAPSAEFTGATGGTINIVLRQASVQRETNIRLTDQRVWGQNAFQGFFSKTGPFTGPSTRPLTTPDKPVVRSADAADDTNGTRPLAVPREPWTYFLAGSASDRLAGSDTHRSMTVTGSNPSTSESDEKYRFRTSEWLLIPRLSGRLGPSDQLNFRSMLIGTRVKGQFDSTGAGADGFGPTSSRVFDNTGSERSLVQLRSDWTHSFKGSRLESYISGQNSSERVDRNRLQTLASYDVGNMASAVTTPSTFLDDRHEKAFTASTKLTGTENPLLWMFGAEAEERRLNVDTASSVGLNATPTPFSLGARTRRSALWGQNEWELPAKTTFTAGLRLESTETRSDYTGITTTNRRTFLQPSLHTRTPINEDLQVRFNLARVSRNPALMDLLDRRIPSTGLNAPNNPDFAGNPGLRPESTFTFDGGLERKLGEQGQLGLNLFVRQIKDVIARRVTDFGAGGGSSGSLWTQRPENVGNATVWGLEADVKSDLTWPSNIGLGRDWTLSSNASLLQSRMTSGDSVGQRIPGQARYLVNVNLAKPVPKAEGWFGGTSLSLTGAADLNTSPTSSGRELAYTSADAYVGRVVAGWGYWRFTVYNITNSKRSRERLDTDSTGRSYAEQSTLRWTPRVFLVVGTRF